MTILRRRCMGEETTEQKPIMNPSFEYVEGYYLQRMTSKPYLTSRVGFNATDFIYVGTTGTLVIFHPNSAKLTGTKQLGQILQYKEINGNYSDWWNLYLSGTTKTYALSANKRYIRFGFDPDTMADLYGYNSTTGEVYFRGRNTPYYEKTNINE